MTSATNEPVLEHLLALRASLDRIEQVQREHGFLLTAVETAFRRLRTARTNRLQARLDRIETRPELNDA